MVSTASEVDNTFTVKSGKRSCIKPLSCKNCVLADSLKIEADLDEYSEVLLVGESPGSEERLKMKPFTGDSGKILRMVAESTGLNKFGIGYTNIVWCEGLKYYEDSYDNYNDIIDRCTKSHLELLIARLKPRLIIACGDVSKRFLLPNERKGILAVSGICSEGYVKGIKYPIMPIMHPAFVMRNPKVFNSFQDHLNEARLALVERPPDVHIFKGSLAAIKKLKNSSIITLDTETSSFYPYDLGKVYFGKRYKDDYVDEDGFVELGRILCLSICGDGVNSYVFDQVAIKKYYKELKDLIENVPVGGQNLFFDVPHLKAMGIHPNISEDTMMLDLSLDESPFHSLKMMGRRYLGYDDWSKPIQKYLTGKRDSYALVRKPCLEYYNGVDSAVTWQLIKEVSSKQDDNDRKLYKTLLLPATGMFTDLAFRGIRIDVSRVMELKRLWEHRKYELIKKFNSAGLRNANSTFQVADHLIKLEAVEENIGTSKSSLEWIRFECKRTGNSIAIEFLDDLKEYREIRKSLDHLGDLAKAVSYTDGRIHPDVKLFGTVTGRLVINHPSLLNYPRHTRLSDELRSVFLPEPGYIWGHWDQKQFELRVYSVYNEDYKIAEILNDPNREIHMETGLEIYGPDFYRLNEESYGFLKVIVKTIQFGRLYLRGEDSIADQLGIPIEEAIRICQIIDNRYEGIGRYRAKIISLLNNQQELINPLGRKRRFPILTNENYHKCLSEASNFPIQSTASDINLYCMLAAYRSKFYKNGYIFPMFPIHDAVEFQIKEDYKDELKEYITELFAASPSEILEATNVKFRSSSSFGYDWAEATRD